MKHTHEHLQEIEHPMGQQLPRRPNYDFLYAKQRKHSNNRSLFVVCLLDSKAALLNVQNSMRLSFLMGRDGILLVQN